MRDSNINVVLAWTCQGSYFLGLELEKVKACHFAMEVALSQSFKSVVLEGDCKSLITVEEQIDGES